jgi:alkylhydroperoxidase family enzyme
MRQQTIKALKNDEDIDDAQDQALVKLVHTMVEKIGWVPDVILKQLFNEGFAQQQVFELIVVVAIKTISNYSNHLTLPEPNKELQVMIEKQKKQLRFGNRMQSGVVVFFRN